MRGKTVNEAWQAFRRTLAVAGREMASECRRPAELFTMLALAFLTLFIFAVALDVRGREAAELMPGALWGSLLFAAAVLLGRSFERDESGRLAVLLLAPIGRSAIYYGKALGNLVLLVALAVVLTPSAAALFDAGALPAPGALALALVLGGGGIVGAGTLLAAVAGAARLGELVTPVLLFPILVPVLLGAVFLTGAALRGASPGELWPWVRVLAAFNVVFWVLPGLVFDDLLEG